MVGMGVDGWSMTMDLQRIIAKFGRSESIASTIQQGKSHSNRNAAFRAFDYGPDTPGTHKEGGGDSENIDENVR
jgi:hypothetical protein